MKAICIKDGCMSWRKTERFCIKGNIYRYETVSYKTRYPYRVDSETSHMHQMGAIFFKSYFRPLEEHFLPENLFDI